MNLFGEADSLWLLWVLIVQKYCLVSRPGLKGHSRGGLWRPAVAGRAGSSLAYIMQKAQAIFGAVTPTSQI